MKHSPVLLFSIILLASCTADRLSHDEARKKVSEIGRSTLVPNAIEIRRVTLQSDTQAVAEANVTLAFQFKRDNPAAEWKIEAVRLGDRDWVSLTEFLAAVDEGRRRTTQQSLQKLAAGITSYRASHGSLPTASNIVELTDVLHPLYTNELIRTDGWDAPIEYEITAPSTFRLISPGPDGRRGTPDDVVFDSSQPATP